MPVFNGCFWRHVQGGVKLPAQMPRFAASASIRMLLEDMLGELGYTIAAEAARIEEALEATKNADFDLAILDADLNGQPALPVADALVTRGTPFVFATGYGSVPEPYRCRP